MNFRLLPIAERERRERETQNRARNWGSPSPDYVDPVPNQQMTNGNSVNSVECNEKFDRVFERIDQIEKEIRNSCQIIRSDVENQAKVMTSSEEERKSGVKGVVKDIKTGVNQLMTEIRSELNILKKKTMLRP